MVFKKCLLPLAKKKKKKMCPKFYFFNILLSKTLISLTPPLVVSHQPLVNN